MVILSDLDPSASSSSATSLKRKRSCDLDYNRYDVFLSFRGSDTRYGFTDHLYDHLKRAGIHTFRDDDELEKGESLKEELGNAIKQSSISIIIFSENYASSTWCLDELVRILEQKKIRDNFKVLPIFYRVDASDVRYQKGSFEKAFNRHKEKGIASLEKIHAWKVALTEIAKFAGFTLNKINGGYETEFIGRIVCEVENSLPNRKDLNIPQVLVGMIYQTREIKSWLKNRSKDNNVLVICGIGGIGKTTIVSHLFNEYYKDFEGSCFLTRITAMWDQIGVCGVQSRLLSTILNKREEIRIYNCDEGTERIKRAICNRKFLLVLDDVSETEQLEALLGQPQRLCPGSKILVTTRNMSLQKDFIIPPKVHNVECLKEKDSLELFSWHAFRQLFPLEEYMQLSKEILLRCGGLPLALVVLGSSLRRKLDIVFWKKQLQKWDEIGNPDVLKVMQISYDSLEDETVKNLFLHVACFFVGEEEDYVVKLLDHCGLHASVGIQNLIDRCLITKITSDMTLMMHPVIQDMGRNIVRKESLHEPGRRSRLWCHEDSFSVLKYYKGTEAVQGLVLDWLKISKVESDGSSLAAADANQHLITKVLGYVKKKKEQVFDRFLPSNDGELKIDAFTKMVNLKFVKLNHVYLTGCCSKFPKKLILISWHGFPLEHVPMELPLQNLVALDLQQSIFKQVWKGYKEVKSLKFLNLSYSLELCQTPDFRGLPQLERLILRGCTNLVKVCKTIGILKGLVLLDLCNCKSLRDLPDLPRSIVTLKLSGCDLTEFPREQTKNDCYSIVKFASPAIATGPIKLLSCLPHFLVKLSLSDCNLTDGCFPRDFSTLSSLNMLDLSGNLMSRLPDCVKNLSNSSLFMLCMDRCPQLRSVIHPPSCVKNLTLVENRQLKRTKVRPNSRTSVYIEPEMSENREYVEIEGCFKWVPACCADKKVIKNLGLESVPIGCVGKVQYEWGIFSTFVKSKKVPSCFKTYFPYEDGGEESKDVSYEKMGRSKVPFTIPSSVGNKKIQGLNICFAIRLDINPDKYLIVGYIEINVTVGNKTKDLAWSYRIHDRFEEAEKRMKAGATFTSFLWVSTWKCEDLLEAGDEIELSFHILNLDGSKIIASYVEKCGIRTVYEEGLEEEEEKDINDSTLLWTYQMDDSFSNYRTPATTYFLKGSLFFVVVSLKKTDGDIGIFHTILSFHLDSSTYLNHFIMPFRHYVLLRCLPFIPVSTIHGEYNKRWCSVREEEWPGKNTTTYVGSYRLQQTKVNRDVSDDMIEDVVEDTFEDVVEDTVEDVVEDAVEANVHGDILDDPTFLAEVEALARRSIEESFPATNVVEEEPTD